MDFTPEKPPVWINKPHQLQLVYKALQHQPRISVDTESNSLFAYQEKVCLIQISSPEEDYLIDPLELHDLSLLGLLFKNPDQEKIFHASEYDLICMKRDFHFSFANIFDTMIAARILGATHVGLDSLLQQFFEIKINKKYQRANWGVRPLPQEMLDYARLDTYYLFKLRDTLEADLISNSLLNLAHEDFKIACKVKAHSNGNNQCECWKVAGANHMDGQQAAILNELCIYRDEQAKKADLPHFKILSNEILFEISRQKPASIEELSAIPHCSDKIIKRHGSGLLKAVSVGIDAPPIYRQRNSRPDDDYIARIDLLKKWRKEKGRELKVESDVVLPRELLENIAAANPQKKSELHKLMSETPVRYQKFGTLIMKELLNKEKP